MQDLQTFANVLLGIAAGIVVLGNAYAALKHLAERPHGIAEKVRKHEERLARDHKRLSELETSDRLIMRGVMQLMSHEIDGNHSQQLRETRDEMEQYLINR